MTLQLNLIKSVIAERKGESILTQNIPAFSLLFGKNEINRKNRNLRHENNYTYLFFIHPVMMIKCGIKET